MGADALSDAQIDAEILASLARRDVESSACPSEVARTLAPAGESWRALMPRIRDRVSSLARDRKIIATRGKRVLPPDVLEGGPIRIRRGPSFQAGGPGPDHQSLHGAGACR